MLSIWELKRACVYFTEFLFLTDEKPQDFLDSTQNKHAGHILLFEFTLEQKGSELWFDLYLEIFQ